MNIAAQIRFRVAGQTLLPPKFVSLKCLAKCLFNKDARLASAFSQYTEPQLIETSNCLSKLWCILQCKVYGEDSLDGVKLTPRRRL